MQNSLHSVEICVYPRLHITLLGMNRGGYRLNGGAGFAISSPSSLVFGAPSSQCQVKDQRHNKDPALEEQLVSLLVSEVKRSHLPSAVSLTISGDMPSHSGFGSGTALRLASLEALHILNSSPISRMDLVQAAKRGGTSGIGVNTYFEGGFVFDLGKSNNGTQHAPSSMANPTEAPLCLDQTRMPDWQIGICVPTKIPTKTQQEEQLFFQRTCPIKDEYVYEALYHVAYGLYPAVLEQDRKTFCNALRAIQKTAWKNSERREYGASLALLEKQIYELGADVVAMSSLGPGLFFLAEDVDKVLEKIRERGLDCVTWKTTPLNGGRKINA